MNAINLDSAENVRLKIGFMRLSDSAPLIIAQEKKFFARYGLEVELCREVSWSNIRDKVMIGALDAAQMLAPMPLMGPVVADVHTDKSRKAFITGLMLSLNGNAITLAAGISERLNLPQNDSHGIPDPVLAARRLRQFIKNSPRQLTLATVYPYSMHTFQLRHWLESGGISPDGDVRIIVLPPEQMVDNLSQGTIDGFCVGEPWNSVAVQAGVGNVMVTGYQIWNNAPEKALVVTEHWHQLYPATHLRLRLAVMEASAWLSKAENRRRAVNILARQHYLDLPGYFIEPALIGRFRYHKHGIPVSNEDFLVFHHHHAGFPWRSRAEYLLRKSYDLVGKTITCDQLCSQSKKVYRTDLFREAAAHLGWDSPQQDYKTEVSHSEAHTLAKHIQLGPDRILENKTFLPCAC